VLVWALRAVPALEHGPIIVVGALSVEEHAQMADDSALIVPPGVNAADAALDELLATRVPQHQTEMASAILRKEYDMDPPIPMR